MMDAVQVQNMNSDDISSDTLVDIKDVNVNMDLPSEERIMDVIEQMDGNPYLFKSGKITVKVSFSNTPTTLNERMENYFRTL